MSRNLTAPDSSQACWKQTLTELKDIQYMAHQMIGPHGRYFMDQDGNLMAHGMDIVNSPMFARCTVTTKVLMDLTRAQFQQCHDGTLLLLYVASSIVLCYASLPFTSQNICESLENCRAVIARNWKDNDTEFGTVHFSLGNAETVRTWARTDIATAGKPVTMSAFEKELLANVALQGCLCFLDGIDIDEQNLSNELEDPLSLTESLKSVRVLSYHCTSANFEDDAQLLKNAVVVDTPVPSPEKWPKSFFRRETDRVHLVLCFQCSLIVSEIADAGAPIRKSSTDLEYYNRFVKVLKRYDIRIVGCQKVISPDLADMLLDNDILPIARLSIRHFGAFCRLSGATPFQDWVEFLESDKRLPARIVQAAGLCNSVEPLNSDSERYPMQMPFTVIQGATSSTLKETTSSSNVLREVLTAIKINQRPHPTSVSTIVAPKAFSGNSTENPLERAFQQFAHRFMSLMKERSPTMVAGNGGFELACSSCLVKTATTAQSSAMSTVSSVLAGVLVRCAWSIAGLSLSHGDTKVYLLDRLPTYLTQPGCSFDPLTCTSELLSSEENKSHHHESEATLDPLKTKLSALDMALQSAQTMLNVRLVFPNLNREISPY